MGADQSRSTCAGEVPGGTHVRMMPRTFRPGETKNISGREPSGGMTSDPRCVFDFTALYRFVSVVGNTAREYTLTPQRHISIVSTCVQPDALY